MTAVQPSTVKLDTQGLVTAICQDAASGKVLMVASMNREAISRTFATRQMYFYSRSREELWHKGATSGAYLEVVSAQVDCDGDMLLFQVKATGPACHTGAESCFFTSLTAETPRDVVEAGPGVLSELFQTVRQRQDERPAGSYTAELFDSGTKRIAQKVAEEGAEVALAGATGDSAELTREVADLFFHTLVLLADGGVGPEEVWKELRNRRR